MLISQEDLRHFVGSKADYYVQQWSKLEQTGKKLSLNKGVFIVLIVGMAIMYLAAGILADYQLSTLLQIVFGVILSLMPLLWFFYRKLYVTMIVVWLCFFGFDLLLYSAVYFIAKIFMSKVELLALVKNNVGWSAGIYVLVSLGKIVYLSSLASFLLYRKATKVITVIKNKEHDSVLQNRMIEGKGGTVTDKLQLLPKSVRQTFLPISMALMAFILSLLIGELKYAETLELLATDNLKFSSKKHINPMSNKKADSDIFIMGITEESEATLVQSLFGPYPYPRETYGDFLSYFHLDIPERLKANFIAASVEFASSQKSAKITQLVNMIYKFENDKYVMREKIKNNPKLREEHANLWFYNVYDMNLEEVKRLTWNSIAPRLVFFDIFFDFPRSKQSDQLFFDELKRQQQYNNIFMDYMTEKTKTGRLSGDTSVQLSERMKYATLWEIKNVKDQFGKKRLADIKDQAIGFDIKPPLLGIVENIPGIGPANILKSFDGKRRRMSLIWTIYDERIMERPIFIPTIDLAIYIHLIYDIKSAEQLQKVMAEKVHFQFGRSVTLKDVTIKKRINYVRQSLTDPDKKYRWMEYIDPFMNRILTKLIEKLKDSNTLSYKRFLSEMLNDKELKKLLISK
ncbi:MAG: hypothetical protein OEZ36_08185, partial [Spirochaetota bacterium]|nr:hypothetical protein [Spirochaetota bacterium]